MRIDGNKITPAEDKLLFNGTAYSDMVFLGVGASADEWQEVDPPAELSNEEREVIL